MTEADGAPRTEKRREFVIQTTGGDRRPIGLFRYARAATNPNWGKDVSNGAEYGGPARISYSSVILLVIFVSAAALIVAAVIWRPWFGDDAGAVQAQPTATADTVVQQAPTETPIGAPQGP